MYFTVSQARWLGSFATALYQLPASAYEFESEAYFHHSLLWSYVIIRIGVRIGERTQAKDSWNLNTSKWKMQGVVFVRFGFVWFGFLGVFFVAAFSKYNRYALILCVSVYKMNIVGAAVHCNLNVVREKFSLTNVVVSRNMIKIICKWNPVE